MKKSKHFIEIPMKKCSLCNKSSEIEGISLIYFGEWMSKKDITVHYYCLLLSTHLPQRGKDNGGILGFFLCDIRLEIAKAKNRKCMYCSEVFATIKCFTCKKYFHLTCGHTSKCLSHFVGEFKSYCHKCIPDDPYQMKLLARQPTQTIELCFICAQIMVANPKRWIYAKCCGTGFTHSKCMKIYALSAGYYLTCIWCKEKQFREDIKYQGIFVPDREANWEKEKDAYGELYRRHKRCDMEVCNCPKGRDYTNTHKWQLISCKFCAAFGAHNPCCIPGHEGSREKLQEYKCDICAVTEQTVFSNTILDTKQDLINSSLYVDKNNTVETGQDISLSQTECNFTQDTQINGVCNTVSTAINSSTSNVTPENIQIQIAAYTLTQSPANSQYTSALESYSKKTNHEEVIDSDDRRNLVNSLVQKVFDIFEVNSSRDLSRSAESQNKTEFVLSQEMSDIEKRKPISMATKSNLKSINVDEASETCFHDDIAPEESSDSDDSAIADSLVQKFLDVFEAN